MSLPMQVKLLRVLQEKVVRRVGGTSEDPVDVRIIAATNQNLLEKIGRGEFREDLFYRINVIPIAIPPLRSRREDIPLLVDHFLHKYSAALGVPPKRISAEAMRLLGGLQLARQRARARESDRAGDRALDRQRDHRRGSADVARRGQARATTRELRCRPTASISRRSSRASAPTSCGRRSSAARGVQTQAAELLRMSFRSFRYYARKAGVTGAQD